MERSHGAQIPLYSLMAVGTKDRLKRSTFLFGGIGLLVNYTFILSDVILEAGRNQKLRNKYQSYLR